MSTRVAITAQNKKKISGHAGHCKNYLVYTIDDSGSYTHKLITLEDNETLHYTFHDDPSPKPHNIIFDMDVLLTQGIGQGAINRLAERNVTAYIIEEEEPEIAIKKLIDGTLEAFAPVNHRDSHGCCGHGHHRHH
jgi:predicted Fe-Mo cluster-binding NifX family protein